MKELGFGLMRLPLKNTTDSGSIDQELTNKMADYFLEQGFTYFDTAYPYHGEQSEAAFKKAVVQRYPRETYTIADKMPVWLVKKNADYQKIFDEQLKRCGVEYFDYYMLHSLNAPMYADTQNIGGFEFIEKMKAAGKIRKTGFSFHDKADVLDRILGEHPKTDFVQLQINYIDWDNKSVQSGKCYETAVKYGKPIIVMEPVKGGCLASLPEEAEKLLKAHNKTASAASWAIRFAASLENVPVILSGMSTFEQMTDNTAIMREFKNLDNEEKGIIKEAAEIINRLITIPCTTCGYCTADCPQKIAIPKYFTLYNNQKRYGALPTLLGSYAYAASGAGRASACTACKQCEERCPQNIPIMEWLKETAKVFEV